MMEKYLQVAPGPMLSFQTDRGPSPKRISEPKLGEPKLGKPTWFTNGKPDMEKLLSIGGAAAAEIPTRRPVLGTIGQPMTFQRTRSA